MEQTIQCLIVDDEAPARRLLEGYVRKIPELRLADSAKNGSEAMTQLSEKKIDLLFLDVQLNSGTGIDLLRKLETPPVTVFTTAFPDFAVEAFDLDAVDYLKKPFSFERFFKAVSKAKEYLRLKEQAPAELFTAAAGPRFLTVKADYKIMRVNFDDILFVEAFQEYIKIHTESNGRIITLERMKNIELLLPPAEFIRVHRSYIVSKARVSSISGNLLSIGEHQVPVSRDLKEQVVRLLF